MALGPVKPHVKAAADAIAAQFGVKTMYGWRPVDPFPDHPSGLAVDFMVSNLPNGKAIGDGIANYVIQNGKALGVKYLIWYRRSYNISRGTWEPYNSSPNPHTDHVHVTWNASAGTGDVVTTPVANPIDEVKSQVSQMYGVFKTLSGMLEKAQDPKWRLRIELGMIGVALIGFGLLKFDKVAAVAGTVTGKVAKVVKNASTK
jgi:hypothetical protein